MRLVVLVTAIFAGLLLPAFAQAQTVTLTDNPTSVVGGSPSVATVTLSSAAPTGGAAVSLTTSDTTYTRVPSSVTVAAGATSATFNIGTSPVPATETVTVTATYGANSGSTTLMVKTPRVTSLTLNPTAVTAGASSSGALALGGAAPAGGWSVSLSSSNAAASVPATVTVAAGATTAAFTVSTTTVTTVTTATITATLGGNSATANLTVNPQTIASVSLSPSTVVGGSTSTGTVNLGVAAPAGGLAVALTSGNTSLATVPASLTVPAGASSATFTITTVAVSATGTSTVTASSGGQSASAVLTVTVPALTVSLNPATVTGGTNSTGTLTLSGPAAAGGITATLTSSSTSATVPGSVTVAAGATSATFTVNTSVVSAVTPATIMASFAGQSPTAALAIYPNISLTLTDNPTSVVGGSPSVATVTLSTAAPTGGAVVSLATGDTTYTRVPSSVTVAAGATTATFNIGTSPVPATETVTVTATYGANTATTSLMVKTPRVTSLTLSPTSLTGGASSTGTITLGGAAPAGGWSVSLSSSSAAATVPATVTVAAGATTATFTVSTTTVTAVTTATITATLGGNSATANLTVNPQTIASVSLNPSSVVGGNPSTGKVTLGVAAPTGGLAVTLTSSNTSVATVPASLTVPAGATSATFTVTTAAVSANGVATVTATSAGQSASATLSVTIPTLTVSLSPTALVGGASSTGTVTLSAPAATGGITVTLTSSSTSATVPGSVTVAAGATSATFTVSTTAVTATSSATITAAAGGQAPSATLTIYPNVSLTLTDNPNSVVGGTTSVATVTLSSAAPVGGAAVALTTSDTTNTRVPATVTVAAGATSATFNIGTSPVASTETVTVTATYAGSTATTTLMVKVPRITAMSMNPTSVSGGVPSTGTLTLGGPAPSGGYAVALTSNNAVVTVPASITVAGGATSATFTATATPVSANVTATITGTLGTSTNTATLTVTPPAVTTLTLNPTSVVSGTNPTATVTISGPAPSGGLPVALSSGNVYVATTPASVTIAAGATSATFTVTSQPVGITATAAIKGTANSQSASATLTVTPGAAATTYPISLTPNPPLGFIPVPMMLPGWMGSVEPVDSSEASDGPSGAVSVNMIYGVASFDSGPDLVIPNPTGPGISFERIYRTALATANLSSPGLTPGWTHNWDFMLVPTTPGTLGTVQLVYPGGANEPLTPVVDGSGNPTGALQPPAGAPYVANGTWSNGSWTQITLTEADMSKDTFMQASDGKYRIQTKVFSNGSPLNFHYQTIGNVPALSSIDNGGSTSLLSLTYSGGLLSAANDPVTGNTRNYAYASGELSTVSYIGSTVAEWTYAYNTVGSASYLASATSQDPQQNPSMTSIGYDPETGQVLARTDPTGFTRTNTYPAVGSGALTITNSSGLVDSFSVTGDTSGRTLTSTTAAGDTTNIGYSGGNSGIPSTITTPQSGPVTTIFDNNGNPQKVTYPYGNSTFYQWTYPPYAPRGLLQYSTETGLDGTTATTNYTYYTTGHPGYLAAVTYPLGNTVSFTYTALGDISQVSDSAGASYTYAYTSSTVPVEILGQPVSVTDSLLNTTLFAYDSAGRLVSTTDPLQNQAAQTYNQYNQVLSMALPMGLSASFTYGEPGRPPVSSSVTQSGVTTTSGSVFDSQSQLYKSTDPNLLTDVFNLDGESDLTSLVNGNGDSVHNITYTPQSRLVSTRFGTAGSLTGLALNSTFYPTGNLYQTTGSDTRTLQMSYLGSDPDLPLTLQAWDTATSWNNEIDYNSRDGFGRITDVVSSAPDFNSQTEHGYTYDLEGNVLTDSLAVSRSGTGLLGTSGFPTQNIYGYNPDGTRQYMVVTLGPAWQTSPNTTSFTYNYGYDTQKRLTSIVVYPGTSSAPVTSNVYGPPVASVVYEYDADSRVHAVRSTKATTFYSYNSLGQVTQVLNLTPDGSRDYYAPSSAIVPDVDYPNDPTKNHTILACFTGLNSNAISYNNLGQRTAMSFTVLKQQGIGSTQSVYATGTATWGYDKGGRLVSENWTTPGGPNPSTTYGYDGAVNLTSIGSASLTVDKTSDRLTSAAVPGYGTIGYDATGEATSFNGNTFAYSPLGQLTTGSGTTVLQSSGASSTFSDSMVYDHLGRRAALTESLTTGAQSDTQFFSWDGDELVYRQFSGVQATQMNQSDLFDEYIWYNGNETGNEDNGVLYIYGPTGLVMEFNRAVSSTILFDPNGSCVATSNANVMGEFYDTADNYSPTIYSAYGQLVWTPTVQPGSSSYLNIASSQPFQYKGQYGCYTDAATGLVYCQNRYYDPNVGRWTSRDPSGLDGGVNVYGYCDGDPVDGVDTDGLQDRVEDDPSWFENLFGRWSVQKYFSDMGHVFVGEAAAVNPIHFAKGIASTVGYIVGKGGSLNSFIHVGKGMVKGMMFWTKDDPEEFGESIMGDTLILAPLIKRIPNLTPLKLDGLYATPKSGGGTIISIDWKGTHVGRLDWGPLPKIGKNANRIPVVLRGRSLPHWHRRGPGGIARHRPWEGGSGSRF